MHAHKHLQERVWKHPDSYGGFSPDGDYVVLSRHRDAKLLSRINWDVACEALSAEPYDGGAEEFASRPTVYHWRARHWAVGWVEYLCVRADAPHEVLTKADEIVTALEDYPILDELRYSAAEFDAVRDCWAQMSVADRVSELQRAGLCTFAARRDELPDPCNDYLYERLSEGL